MRDLIERLSGNGFSFCNSIKNVLKGNEWNPHPRMGGFSIIKLGPYSYNIKKGDEIKFLKHMEKKKCMIPDKAIGRKEYESVCRKIGVKPVPDEDIGSEYENADYGMAHYDTVERNRESGLVGAATQARWYGKKKEMREEKSVKMRGQLWEPCKKCGAEPSYMPLHLCKKCWPK